MLSTVVVAWALAASALPAAPETRTSSVTTLRLGGVPGFWVPSAEFRRLNEVDVEAPSLHAELDARKREATELRESLVLTSSAASTSVKALERAGAAVDQLAVDLREALADVRVARADAEAARAWKPIALTALGVIAGALVLVGFTR